MNVPGASYTYQYQRPVVTADVVAFSVTKDSVKVCLIVRGKEPYKDFYALPGGHVDPGNDNYGEPIIEAACRELREEVACYVSAKDLRLFGYYDRPHRDPRGWYITFAYYVVFRDQPALAAGDDAVDARWVALADLNHREKIVAVSSKYPLAFDHRQIIRDAFYEASENGAFEDVDQRCLIEIGKILGV